MDSIIEHTNLTLPTNEPDAHSKNSEENGLIPSQKVIKIAGPIPKPALFIIVMELCERFAFYGASLLFVGYLTKQLNVSDSSATAINRTFQFFAYFTTIIGAILADTYLGKFKTIMLFSSFYFVGLLCLSLSATSYSIENGFGLPGFCFSVFVFIAWGTGGIKSNVSAFAAEQVPNYKDNIVLASNSSEQITYELDYEITVERVFRYFYWAINVGSLIGQALCSVMYHKVSSISYVFFVPSLVFLAGMIIFAFGAKHYKSSNQNGTNPILKALRCIRYSMKQSSIVDDTLDNSTEETHFLDRALINTQNNNSCSEFDRDYVNDLKKSLSACKVFAFYVVYWALYSNMSDSFIIQGRHMRKPGWIQGEEQLNVINSLVLIVAIPIFDIYLFPFLRRSGFKLKPITRIAIGFGICSISFLYTTILQYYIYHTGPYYDFSGKLPANKDDQYNNISLLYQVVPYALIAISEIFSSATGLEYAFKFASKELKSVVLSLFLLTNCGGSLIGIVLAHWSYDPNYFNLFAVQTLTMFVITVVFYALFRTQDNEQSINAE